MNEFTVFYEYDYSSAEYQYSFTYPQMDSQNPSYQIHGKKTAKTIYMPAYYTEAEAEKYAKRLYSFWKCGLDVFREEYVYTANSLGAEIGNQNQTGVRTQLNVSHVAARIINKLELSVKNNHKKVIWSYSQPRDDDGAWV